MKGFPIVAVHGTTNTIITINEVKELNAKADCICGNCYDPLVPVLNTTKRIQHFRHKADACNFMPETELHLLAKHILLNNDYLLLSEQGIVNYSNPRAEIKQNELIPDVTIEYNKADLFIEIVVTNPIDYFKKLKYQKTLAKVLVINLSEEDREIPYEKLIPIVLNNEYNREWLTYENNFKTKKPEQDNSFLQLKYAIGAFFVVLFGYLLHRDIKSSKQKPKIRSNYHKSFRNKKSRYNYRP